MENLAGKICKLVGAAIQNGFLENRVSFCSFRANFFRGASSRKFFISFQQKLQEGGLPPITPPPRFGVRVRTPPPPPCVPAKPWVGGYEHSYISI